MSHRTDGAERWALTLLNEIVARDRQNRDVLPGSVMHHVKAARRILIKMQKKQGKPGGREQNDRSFSRKEKSRQERASRLIPLITFAGQRVQQTFSK